VDEDVYSVVVMFTQTCRFAMCHYPRSRIKVPDTAKRDQFFALAADPASGHIEERHGTYAKGGRMEALPFYSLSATTPFSPPANHVAALRKKEFVKKSEVCCH
jgi:hypothetical protein